MYMYVLYMQEGEGGEVELRLLQPGQYFGEQVSLLGQPYSRAGL